MISLAKTATHLNYEWDDGLIILAQKYDIQILITLS